MTVINEFLIWLQNWVGVIASLGSLILSGLLVLLYRQQRDILNEQKELTESSKQAVIRVNQIDFIQGSNIEQSMFRYTGDFEPWRVHQDYFLMLLSNFGDSPAVDLHLELRLYYSDSRYLQIQTALSRSIVVSNQMAFNGDSDVIGAGERDEFFIAQMSAEKDSIPEQWAESLSDVPDTIAPSEVMYLASEAGEEKLEAHLNLIYSDSTGEREPIKIHATEFNPNKYTDIGSALKQGRYLME